MKLHIPHEKNPGGSWLFAGTLGLIIIAVLILGWHQRSSLAQPRLDGLKLHWNQVEQQISAGPLPPAAASRIQARQLTGAQWQTAFAVFTERAIAEDLPPVAGDVQISEGRLVFVPRYPYQPGLKYHARLHVHVLAGLMNGHTLDPAIQEVVFHLEKPVFGAQTKVSQIFPNQAVIPANTLKFYIHFSQPMSLGQAYEHVQLLNEAGEPLENVFLELEEELWDSQFKRFTLFVDPGRIKRGLRSYHELGPAFEPGRVYTLVVATSWKDGNGQSLAAPFQYTFKTGETDRRQPNPDRWQWQLPPSQSHTPLILNFGEPMDHALVNRTLSVLLPDGSPLAGRQTVSADATQWQFTPQKPWQTVSYQLRVEKILEDLAGNNLRNLFDTPPEAAQKASQADSANQPAVLLAFTPLTQAPETPKTKVPVQ